MTIQALTADGRAQRLAPNGALESTSQTGRPHGVPVLVFAALSALLLSGSVASQAAADEPVASEKPLPVMLVDTLNMLSGGPHPGFRANHAKGILLTGTFTPAAGASSFSKAPHFANPVPVTVRFSNGTGVPTIPDSNPNASPHGIAIRFQLADGASTDIVSISARSFPVATPEEFLALLQSIAASSASKEKPSPVEKFLAAHPAAAKWVTTPRPAPVSFATLAFYGVNSFKFINAKGESRYARYQILPLAGEHALDAAEADKAAPDYLMTELPLRIAKSPVEYRLLAQVAKAGDPIDDATVEWPADRERVELGVLALSGTIADQVPAQKALLFNPLALPNGIEPSADPVLMARPAAYAVSYGQRAQ